MTDAGSTKQDVVAGARRALGRTSAQFVPAHPIAGAELSGVEAASAEPVPRPLVVLTPSPETDPAAQAAFRRHGACAARGCGRMSPAAPRSGVRRGQPLPHVLAFGAGEHDRRATACRGLFAFAGAGFRDFTRIAGSSPEMWRDICIANARAARWPSLEAFQARAVAPASNVWFASPARAAGLFEAAYFRSRRAPDAYSRRRSCLAADGSGRQNGFRRWPILLYLDSAAADRRPWLACGCPAPRASPIARCCWPPWHAGDNRHPRPACLG